jgi:hypothetical protein
MKLLQILPILGALFAAPSLHAQSWTSLGGEAVDLASGGGRVYAIKKDQTVAHYSGGQWSPYPGGSKAVAIEADANGTPYIASTDGGIYRGTGNGWSAMPRAGQMLYRVAVDGKGVVWAIDGYHNLYRFDGERWVGSGTSVLNVSGDPRGGLLFVNGGAKAHRFGSTEFANSPFIGDIAADAAGNPLVVGRDGKLHGWNGSGFVASTPGLSPRGLAIGSAGEIFAILAADSTVWMYGSSGGGTGGSTGGSTGGNVNNRPPNAPTPTGPASTFDVPIYTNPGQRYPSVRLSWRDNGDPDGDPIQFYIQITRWEPASQTWQEIYKDYTSERTGFTFTPQHGLLDVGYYAWTVMAADPAQLSTPAATATPYQYFFATLVQE